MTPTLRKRLARTFGWTVEDTRSFSLQSLRELVRPVSQQLAHELDLEIRGGRYIVQDNGDAS